jgi:membrane protein YqaA with SNARE-associated domain
MSELIHRSNINVLIRRHRFYAKSGFYVFLMRNTLKVLLIIALLIAALFAIEKWIIDTDVFFEYLFNDLNNGLVISIFAFSQALLGFIPPDLFIIWSRKFDNPWGIVALLSILSYIGGIISFWLGTKIQTIPKVNSYISTRYKNYIVKIRRWGALFIVSAALLPIPYSTVCFLIGIIQYPFKTFIWLGLFRILRFFIYGLILFGILSL